eukprot:scaffold295117_cov18-Prasinocladus_malaysianus.AAC.2
MVALGMRRPMPTIPCQTHRSTVLCARWDGPSLIIPGTLASTPTDTMVPSYIRSQQIEHNRSAHTSSSEGL